MDILKIIISEGLSIRQIPKILNSKFSYRNFVVGDVIVLDALSMQYNYDVFKLKHSQRTDLEFDDVNKNIFIKSVVRQSVPKNAGFWMCKKTNNTSSQVFWNTKTDNLAPTLEESVLIFLEKMKNNENKN